MERANQNFFARLRKSPVALVLTAELLCAPAVPLLATGKASPGFVFSVFLICSVFLLLVVALWRAVHMEDPAALNAYEKALEVEGAGFWQVEINGGNEEISPGLRRMLGLSPGARSLHHLLAQCDAASADNLKQAVADLKFTKSLKPFFIHSTDGKRSFDCRSTSFWEDDESHPTHIVLWLYETTQQQRTLQQLTRENERLKNDFRNFSIILNMAPYPIWQRGADLAIEYYNLGYSHAAEEAGDRSNESGVPELDGKARALARMANESGEPKSERRHVIVDGQRRLFQINELPVPQEHITVGFAQDVTEIEQLQEELQRHISAQADLLESSASAMAIYGPDTRLVTFNYAFVTLWKLDEAWLENEPAYSEILEALREKRKLPEQANFQVFKQQQMKLFTDLIEPREEFYYLPDGKALRVIVIPHALGGLMFAYEDVTDRLALERSYNTLIAVQRETLDNLHEAVAVYGEDGRLKLSNPGFLKLWKISKEEAEAEPHLAELVEQCKPLYVYDDWEAFKKERVQLIQQRQLGAFRMEMKDGKVIDWSTVPLPDGATLVTYIDVTDSTLVERSLREKNEALQDADRLKTEFLANVSYELRSPLTSISGFSEMLRQDYFGALSEKQKEYVEGIHASSQHLMQLINDILDLASVEAGYMRLEVTRFDIHAMMENVLSLIQERVKEMNLKVAFECSPKIGKLLADETRIKQILFNLLSNAIKYSPSGGKISFGAVEQGKDEIVFFVADEGGGIPESEQKAIFEKFYKGSTREVRHKSARKTGTGLGLSIVKTFIEMHGGKVELASAEKKGTKVSCTLPRNNPELQAYVKPKRGRSAAQEDAA